MIVRHTAAHEAARSAPPAKIGFGLGDAVALVAQPIARAVDAVAGTDLKNCVRCNQRQRDWNAKLHL